MAKKRFRFGITINIGTNNMMDFMLRFDSEQSMLDILTSQNMTRIDENNNVIPILGSHQYALDIIGIIPPDVGFCVNLRVIDDSIDTSVFETYLVYPEQPYRIWA